MNDADRELLAADSARRYWVYALAYGQALEALEGQKLNKSQRHGAAHYVAKYAELWVLKIEKYEIKTLRLELKGRFIMGHVAIGMRGDEGTMAEYTCRNKAWFYVGPRGGVRVTSDGH